MSLTVSVDVKHHVYLLTYRMTSMFLLTSTAVGFRSPRYVRHGWLGVKTQLNLSVSHCNSMTGGRTVNPKFKLNNWCRELRFPCVIGCSVSPPVVLPAKPVSEMAYYPPLTFDKAAWLSPFAKTPFQIWKVVGGDFLFVRLLFVVWNCSFFCYCFTSVMFRCEVLCRFCTSCLLLVGL